MDDVFRMSLLPCNILSKNCNLQSAVYSKHLPMNPFPNGADTPLL